MSRAERAKEYFKQGYACSQAVALAFADVMGVDEQTIEKIMLPFGGGVGRLRLTCGAVSGMVGVVGMVFAKAENTPRKQKEYVCYCAGTVRKIQGGKRQSDLRRIAFGNESSCGNWRRSGRENARIL